MRCTWKGCTADGTVPQNDRNGQRWALLCAEHNQEIERAITTLNAKALLRAWVLASGGNPLTRPSEAKC